MEVGGWWLIGGGDGGIGGNFARKKCVVGNGGMPFGINERKGQREDDESVYLDFFAVSFCVFSHS